MPEVRPPASALADPTAKAAYACLPGDAEWLLTDGRGGYACGTARDLAMRRYHGFWIVRPAGEVRRRMVVAALDERVGPRGGDADDGVPRAHLMHAHWRGQARPSPGHAEVDFRPRPVPSWTFRTAYGSVTRQVVLQRAADGQPSALLVRWRNLEDRALRLHVRPLLGWCDADHLPQQHESFAADVCARGASWGVQPDASLPRLWLSADGVASYTAEPVWYTGFVYELDRRRGYDHVGDRWSPGFVAFDLRARGEVTLAFALGEPVDDAALAFDAALRQHEQSWRRASADEQPLTARLALGGDDFLYRGVGDRLGVLAGFPWFFEWGRDVFLALPGLTLAREDAQTCAEVLTGCLPFLHRGLLPNVYGRDIASSDYGSCDAALWFALAVQRFADAGHDPELVRERLLPALRSIVEHYRAGTDLGMAVTADGLLAAGREDLNATWMDARTARGPVTPRAGLPVEIQALWYALLAFVAEHEPDDGGDYAGLRDRCGEAFVRAFWLKQHGYLADCVHDDIADRTVRPNMVVASALARSPLTMAKRRKVVDRAGRELRTPRGLRTLSPDDPRYVGVYGGGPEERDRAYHQGTVWPWLLGFFVEASLRATAKRSRKQRAREHLAELDELLRVELERGGIDHVNEVYDGDPPHRPGGTFAQAWNTGELLRAYRLCRDVLAGAVELV
ncbi:MAG TPA: hypothetical protein ENI87_03290 [bacterium]|nr:hypothetical protein [bacterium]